MERSKKEIRINPQPKKVNPFSKIKIFIKQIKKKELSYIYKNKYFNYI